MSRKSRAHTHAYTEDIYCLSTLACGGASADSGGLGCAGQQVLNVTGRALGPIAFNGSVSPLPTCVPLATSPTELRCVLLTPSPGGLPLLIFVCFAEASVFFIERC